MIVPALLHPYAFGWCPWQQHLEMPAELIPWYQARGSCPKCEAACAEELTEQWGRRGKGLRNVYECRRKYKGKEEITALPEPGMDETPLKKEKNLTLQL